MSVETVDGVLPEVCKSSLGDSDVFGWHRYLIGAVERPGDNGRSDYPDECATEDDLLMISYQPRDVVGRQHNLPVI